MPIQANQFLGVLTPTLEIYNEICLLLIARGRSYGITGADAARAHYWNNYTKDTAVSLYGEGGAALSYCSVEFYKCTGAVITAEQCKRLLDGINKIPDLVTINHFLQEESANGNKSDSNEVSNNCNPNGSDHIST